MSRSGHPVPIREPIGITCHLPRDRQFFAGETFKATLRFRNDASYPLERLTYTVEMQTPSQRRVTLHKSTTASLAPKEQKEAAVEYRLTEPNEYLFRVSVAYTDFTGELKNLSPLPERIVAPKAIDETIRKIHMLKDKVSNKGVAMDASGAVYSDRYYVSIGLMNKASATVKLTGLRFVPRDPSVVVMVPPRVAANPIERTSHGEPIASVTDVDEFMPYDTMRFVTEVMVRRPSKPATTTSNSSAPSDTIFFSSSAASVPTNYFDLGHFEWAWAREPDVKGQDSSALFRISKGPSEPDMHLQVVGVYPPVPCVGDAVTLTLQITNNFSDRRDVSLTVHISKLLPQFLYNGPMLVPIGQVAAGTALLAHVHLIAHYPGLTSLVGCLELRETARPEVTLWPTFPTQIATQPITNISGAQVPTMGVISAEGFPPKLADIFVMYPSEDADEDAANDL